MTLKINKYIISMQKILRVFDQKPMIPFSAVQANKRPLKKLTS